MDLLFKDVFLMVREAKVLKVFGRGRKIKIERARKRYTQESGSGSGSAAV